MEVKLMTEFEEIMNSGKIYKVMGTNQDTHYFEYLQQMETYNSLGYTEEGHKEKQRILKELFAEIGENSYIQAPYHAMWGGHHVHLGKNVYINFNCTFVDDAQIYIGDNTMIAPNATIIAASHPISPSLRAEGYGCNKPVYIGENVWIASNVTILPGVHIGNNSIIGAGSVVTKDIPANVIALGNPIKILREITPDDDIYYDHGKLISENIV
jgi:galactoside O-acetyltransferase